MLQVQESLPFYRFENLWKFRDQINHGVSTRHGGVSKDYFESLNLGIGLGDSADDLEENYRRFFQAVGIDMKNLVMAFQGHSDRILVIEDEKFLKNLAGDMIKNPLEGYDGFITNLKNVPLMVRFADCQGVLFFDPDKKVIGAVHSGWRGNVKNILGKAVRIFKEKFGSNPADLVVGISPSLGPCCAEFTDPFIELPPEMHKYIKGNKVDLWQCSRDQLMAEGMKSENIEIACRCTVCENKEFFSYRAGKRKTGHMGAVICLKI